MKKVIYQKQFVSLVLNTEIPAIYENWQGSVSRDEFQTALEKKLDLYIEHKQEFPNLHWIVNLRGLRVNQEGQAWANNEFHPKLHLNGVQKIAFIVPENTLHLLDNEQLSSHLDSKKQIELCYFDNLAEASTWLIEIPIGKK